jgi:putative redox protein
LSEDLGTTGAKTAAGGETVAVDETGLGRFQVEARIGANAFLIDEPAAVGGLGSGPNPFDLLSAALGSCTAMTIRLYAERKAWPLAKVRVRATHSRGTLDARDRFSLEIALEGDLDESQRARLMEIAQRCPVHLTLERGSEVASTLTPADAALGDNTRTLCEHMTNMEEACSD